MKRFGRSSGVRTVEKTSRWRRPADDAGEGQPSPDLSGRAKDKTLVLHIGLHKTATTYLQGVLAACREDLRREGVLYPTTGIIDKAATGTREGAGSGQALLSRPGRQRAVKARLFEEIADDDSTVLVSSEEFGRPSMNPSPDRLVARFSAFREVKVVVVLRRQDDWIESFYKQVVDQFNNYETRSFRDYLHEAGRPLLDYHARFSPWRERVGAENFHVLSYDDLPDGAAICRRLLEISGVTGPLLDRLGEVSVPRFESVRAIDTVGLRILNGYRLTDRATRQDAARAVYDAAPAGDIDLMTPDLRQEIHDWCRPVNERIEAEWFTEPVPGLRFGSPPRESRATPPSGQEMVDYVDRVITLCEEARKSQPTTSEDVTRDE